MKQVNEIKDEIQRHAHQIWVAAGRNGTIAAGTGFGKSRIPILEVQDMAAKGLLNEQHKEVLLVSPSVKLRDENWPEEFQNWGCSELFNNHVESICLASLKKKDISRYKLIVLDEIHRLTELSAQFFQETGEDLLMGLHVETTADVMGLTATTPEEKREPEKAALIRLIAPVVFRYSLDQGVEDNMIADYHIHVIQFDLDDTRNVIPSGTKARPFKTTEKKFYSYLETTIKRYRTLSWQAKRAGKLKEAVKFESLVFIKTMERNRFIGASPSKTEIAKRCLKQIDKQGKRTLVFCADINQCNELMAPNVYHSKSDLTAYLKFNNKEISTMGVVDAVNEGINFTDLAQALIVKINSSARVMTQRIGRCLRLKDGVNHTANIYLLCAKDTVEEKWLAQSLEGFNPDKITYYSAKNIPE